MFGANLYGAPYFGQAYAGSTSTPETTPVSGGLSLDDGTVYAVNGDAVLVYSSTVDDIPRAQ